MDKKKVGIIGTGKFAGHHLNAWRTIDNIEISGVFGSDAKRRDAFCERFGIKGYEDCSALIGDSDIVDIVSANYTHGDYALRALELDIIDSYIKGVPSSVTIRDGFNALRTVLGLYESSETSKRVYLEHQGVQ